MNIRNAKEVKEKVEEIKKKRVSTNSTPNNKKSNKTAKAKSKIKWWKIILVEYFICFGIVVTCWCLNTMRDYYKIYDIVYTQQVTIKNLVQWIQDNAEIQAATSEDEVCPPTSLNLQDLGEFKITYYCACTKCCGKNAKGITASGKPVEINKTIAVDPRVIKLGSQVKIGDTIYEAQDTGSAIKGNIIDIYVASHQEALNLGVDKQNVYLVKE